MLSKGLFFKEDLVETMKTKENISHALAFVTIDVLQTVPVGIAAGALLFTVLNTLV